MKKQSRLQKKSFVFAFIIGILIVLSIFLFIQNQAMISNEPVHETDGMMQQISKKEVLEPLLYDLPQSQSPQMISLHDGGTLQFSADIVRHTINGKEYRMYGYNQQIPGPIFTVQEDTTITVDFTNNLDQPTTIHWHGLRHNNKDDGVAGVTQDPIFPGKTFTYTLSFPDAGMYWYHPHMREDMQQDLGLAGNIFVTPLSEDIPANKEELLVLDDILLDGTTIVSYGKDNENFALTGRFGNTMLVNGKTDYTLHVNKGDVTRFYITNVANVRPFNIIFEDTQMKLVGSDLSLYEQPKFVTNVIISPGERYIVDVLFEAPGTYAIKNKNPQVISTLGKIIVEDKESDVDYSSTFADVQPYQQVVQDIAQFKQYFEKPVDYTLDLTVDAPHVMHTNMMDHDASDGIEWEDSITMMNRQMTTKDVRWIIEDRETQQQNMDLTITAHVGDVLKIRIFNDPKSNHPMQHPMHLHGQRFLVLNHDGVPNDHLVWKDTVLVPAGSTIDILVDVTNPGTWMLHCHIAEHLEAGMMASLVVES